jgi:heme-degrading monooxygenase HmoA
LNGTKGQGRFSGLVLALSRFKVANGREEAVREAFHNRPGWVDNAPGFLGLEVFTDSEDSSQFYLVTRWTDVDSFQRWHAGPDHGNSHQGIPKGLKLDPAFTLVRTLDRIADPAASWCADGVRDYAPVIAQFLAGSTTAHWLKMRTDGVIVASTPAIAKALGRALESLEGTAIWPLLIAADVESLRSAVASGVRDPATQRRLSFTASQHPPLTLDCRVDVQPDGFVLIGEAVPQDDAALETELAALNNRFAVLLREHDRQAKALRKANAALAKALKDWQDSHWHIKKIQEVLPICMSCGKVKTGEAKWEEIVEYLKRNSLFLSHGYCPDCVPREEA